MCRSLPLGQTPFLSPILKFRTDVGAEKNNCELCIVNCELMRTFAPAEAGSTAVPARGGRKVRATQSAVLLNGKMAARS